MIKKILSFFALITAFILFSSILCAGSGTKITSVSMVPTNPGYGDLVQITVNTCSKTYDTPYLAIAISTQSSPQTVGTGGQVFVVDSNGIDKKDVSLSSTTSLGYAETAVTGATAGQCTDCGGANGVLQTYVFTVTMPAAGYFSNVCNPTSLYVVVGIKGFGMILSDWTALANDCSTDDASYYSAVIPISVPAPAFSITGRYEGTVKYSDDYVLFAADYSYGGSGVFTITDAIPGTGEFKVVSYGPTNILSGSVAGPAAGSTGGTYTWTFPSRTSVSGTQTGMVWMLLEDTSATAGNVYTNTVTAAQVGNGTKISTTSITIGAPALSIKASESAASLMTGSTITYMLSYDLSGSRLVNFQPFDDITTGTYTYGGWGTLSTGAPSGWKFSPDNGTYGTWTISDPCSTGGSYITGSSTTSTYPGLLLNSTINPGVDDQFCTGTILSDFYIDDAAYNGADARVIIRSNGLTGTAERTISVTASIDNSPGYLALSVCGGSTATIFCGTTGPAGSYTNSPSIGAILAKKWYRMRIAVTDDGSGGQIIKVRVWSREDPEPAVWDINYDVAHIGSVSGGGASDWACDGTGSTNDWRPGISENAAYSGVSDSYDNFTVLSTTVTAADAVVYDTIPTNVGYIGCSGGGTESGGLLKWDTGSVSAASGSYTWWGTVFGCSTITNQASMGGTGLISVNSNQVVADAICWSPTVTPTITATFTATLTPTIIPSQAPTGTFTQTATFSAASASPTGTNTYVGVYTATNIPVDTASITPTGTYTITNTLSPINIYSETPTVTFTCTLVATATSTDAAPPATITPTQTLTATPVMNATATMTPTTTMDKNIVIINNVISAPEHGCTVRYYVEKKGKVRIKIYNRRGAVIKKIKDTEEGLEDGLGMRYEFTWNGTNEDNKNVVSGIYYAVLDVCGKLRTVKIAVIR